MSEYIQPIITRTEYQYDDKGNIVSQRSIDFYQKTGEFQYSSPKIGQDTSLDFSESDSSVDQEAALANDPNNIVKRYTMHDLAMMGMQRQQLNQGDQLLDTTKIMKYEEALAKVRDIKTLFDSLSSAQKLLFGEEGDQLRVTRFADWMSDPNNKILFDQFQETEKSITDKKNKEQTFREEETLRQQIRDSLKPKETPKNQ